MDDKRRMHLCSKTIYTSGKIKYILFEKGKFYESRRNLIYSKTEYSDPINNRYRVYFDNSYADIWTKECIENIKLTPEEAVNSCYIWADVKDLIEYNLTTYTIKEYTAIIRENRIDSILGDI
jgi:hypothetical protein